MDLEEAKNEARAQIEGLGGLERLAERIGAKAQATAVFAPAVERDGLTVIPVAKASWGFGGGAGTDGAEQRGSGGGGGVAVKPVGFIELGPQGARFRPLRARRNAALAAVAAGLAGIAAGALARRS